MKWEYRIVSIDDRIEMSQREDYWNEMGQEGWELVAANERAAFFKRQGRQKRWLVIGKTRQEGAEVEAYIE